MPRILVVDDDESVRSMLVSLGTRAGFEVVEASGGTDGLRMAASLALELVILDISMPEPDGHDVLIRLKANPATRALPVVVFSGRDAHCDRILGLELGAADYVEKPGGVAQLFRAVRRRLEKVNDARSKGELPSATG